MIHQRKLWHKSITDERIEERARAGMFGLDDPGICICCGIDVEGCEPDTRARKCERCRGPFVYGAQELLFRIAP